MDEDGVVVALQAAEDRIYRLCNETVELVRALYRVYVTKTGAEHERYGRVINRAAARGDRRHQAWRKAWIKLNEEKMRRRKMM